MAGPASQKTAPSIRIPPGEAQKYYAADSLAFKVQNLERTPEGTLRSVVGPTPYEPDRGIKEEPATGVTRTLGTSNPHGIFHASLKAGMVDTLVIRAGSKLYRHCGWYRGWEEIDSGLSDETRPGYPDQFVTLNDLIIWTNGIDQARIIDTDGSSTIMGFAEKPSRPTARGPMSQNQDANTYANYYGYSWVGKIGTVGDLLSGQTSAVLEGSWYYYVLYEDFFGNLSAMSAPSTPVTTATIQSDPYNASLGLNASIGEDSSGNVTNPYAGSVAPQSGAELDDLTRQFLVELSSAPDNTAAMRVYRTQDTKNKGETPRFLVRIPNNRETSFPDNLSDQELGGPMPQTTQVPVFRTMCTHQGRLVIANTLEDPGIVRRSMLGLPGTFETDEFTYPDSGGAEVTALASHQGYLLAFTESSVYSLQDFKSPVPLSQGIGCVAPRSIKALPDGTLIWLGQDGFYGLSIGAKGGVGIQFLSGVIDRTTRYGLNRARKRLSVACVDPESQEYRCALAPSGQHFNKLVLAFDGKHWRRQEYDIHLADWVQLSDWRQYVLAIGKEVSGETSAEVQIRGGSERTEVFVMNRSTGVYTPPNRKVVYRSAWIRGDELGLVPLSVRTMYIGMIDAFDGNATVRFYRNGSWKEVVSMSDLKVIGVDDDSEVVSDTVGNAVIGTAKTHDPRLFWRQVPVGLETVGSWAFEIEVQYPTRLHLASFTFDMSVATGGNIRSRVPLRDDE